jgi:hypothetical protein
MKNPKLRSLLALAALALAVPGAILLAQTTPATSVADAHRSLFNLPFEQPSATLARALINPATNAAAIYVDASGAPVITGSAANLGTVASNSNTVSVKEYSPDGVLHKTVFTFTNTPLTLLDATVVGGGTKIYDFPEGTVYILGSYGSVAGTTTSVLADTLNTGVTYNWGIGTVTQSTGTLATTQQDILPTTNGTASATINVAGAASAGARVAAGAYFDGTSTAKDAFFNVGVASATDLDADATTTWTGTVTIVWMYLGDK